MAVVGEKITISTPYGAIEQLVADRPAIHKKILVGRVPPIEGWQAGKPGQAKSVAICSNGDGICGKIIAHNGVQAVQAGIDHVTLRVR